MINKYDLQYALIEIRLSIILHLASSGGGRGVAIVINDIDDTHLKYAPDYELFETRTFKSVRIHPKEIIYTERNTLEIEK